MYLLAAVSLGLGSLASALGAKILIPLIVGIIIVPTMQALKRALSWLDRASPKTKNAVVGFLSIIGVTIAPLVSALIGMDVPADITQWDQRIVAALLSSLLAIAFKQRKQLDKAQAVLANVVAEERPDVASPAFPFDIPPTDTRKVARPGYVLMADGTEWPLPGTKDG